MKEGEFGDGEHVLRAKIDMAHTNMIMRDPVLYRIRHASHYRRGDEWCIYPLYDFTHCLSDAFEDITHSLCTLEFDNNREIYDWLLDEVGFEEPRTHQYEFARTEPGLHRREQAEAPEVGERRACGGLGRSPDAHPGRHAAQGHSPGGHVRASPRWWAWPRPTTGWTWGSWSSPSGIT